MDDILRPLHSHEELGSKIPKLQGAQAAKIATDQQLDQRLAEKLRAQISPSRIPHILQQATTEAIAQHDRALQPTSHREHRKQPSQGNLQDMHNQQDLHSSGSGKHTEHSSSNSPQRSLPRMPQLHEQQHSTARTAERLQPTTPGRTQQQQQQQQQQEAPGHASTSVGHLHAPHHQQQPAHGTGSVNRPHAAAAAAAAVPSGWGASLKMHDFLMAQQRRREQYWMSKYGKMLLPPVAVQAAGKPSHNPASLFRHPAGPKQPHSSSTFPNSSSTSSSPVKLPMLPAGCSAGSSSQAGSSSRGTPRRAEQQHSRPAGAVAAAAEAGDGSAAAGQLPAVGSRCGGAAASAAASGSGSSSCLGVAPVGSSSGEGISTVQQQQQQQQHEDAAAFDRLKAKITLASVPKLSVTCGLQWGGAHAAAPAGHGSSSGGQGSRARQLPCRDLESELQVLRAVHAREDAVDKLRACCNKIDAAAVGAGGTGCMLLPSEPLGRLFYRLVASLRTKTLDVIESHAAWQRKICSSSDPFSYKGRPYLLNMGQALGFLDEAPWLAGRLLQCAAVQDVLLAELTPDGVALDAVAGFDVRHGALHVGAEAMRIHMARKLLAAAGAQLPPDTPHSLAAAMLQQQHEQAHYRQQQQQQQQAMQLHDPQVHQRHQQAEVDDHHQQHTSAAAAAAAALGILSARGGPSSASPASSGENTTTSGHEMQGGLSGLVQLNLSEYIGPEWDAQQQQVAATSEEQQQQAMRKTVLQEDRNAAACQQQVSQQLRQVKEQLQQVQEALPDRQLLGSKQQRQQQQLLLQQYDVSGVLDELPGDASSILDDDGRGTGRLETAAGGIGEEAVTQSACDPLPSHSADYLVDAQSQPQRQHLKPIAAAAPTAPPQTVVTEERGLADSSTSQEQQAGHAGWCKPAAAAEAELPVAHPAADADEVIAGLLDALLVAVEADAGDRMVDQLLLELFDELEASC